MHDDEVIPLHAPFEIVLRGFNRQQVLDHLESLEGRIAMIAADRDAALRQAADLSKVLEHLRGEATAATERVQRLQRSSLGGAGVRIERMLQMAEDEITALQASTERETTSLLERTRAEADRLLRETTQRCAHLEEAAEKRRSTAEAESVSRIRDYQTRGVSGLHLLLQMAGQRLSRRVAEIEQETTRLTQLRSDVTARLSQAHRMLGEALGHVLQPIPGAQDESRKDVLRPGPAQPPPGQGQVQPAEGSPPGAPVLTKRAVTAAGGDRG